MTPLLLWLLLQTVYTQQGTTREITTASAPTGIILVQTNAGSLNNLIQIAPGVLAETDQAVYQKAMDSCTAAGSPQVTCDPVARSAAQLDAQNRFKQMLADLRTGFAAGNLPTSGFEDLFTKYKLWFIP